VFGQNGDDQLDGGAGNDRLLGESGRDVLLAGDGDDVLSGGSNSDTLAGGAGQDSFVFGEGEVGATPNTADRITDFSQADGDRISLRQIDADTAQAGDQNFQFQGSDDFTGIAGQVRYRHHDGNTFVEGDTDGDGTADFAIRLDGLHTLAAGDFVL